MDKLKMHSQEKVKEHIAQIAALFPNALTETIKDGKVEQAIDFDILKQELSDIVVDGPAERYQFTWPDKKKSILLANAPIAKTLRPCREESINFDTTENLYIEGDNLDVLKLLQETYLGKIKMIYIDPPYNTGKDFIYEDDFVQNVEEYLPISGQFDEKGGRLIANLESNGRFHTDWLNMIYPRLKLAKDLLSDDGTIFISIDESEFENLKKICDEIFGRRNFISSIANVNNPKGRSDDKYIATAHEYLLIYKKRETLLGGWDPEEKVTRRYRKIDAEGNPYREIDLRKTGDADRREDRPNMYYYFFYNDSSGELSVTRNDVTQDGFVQIKPIRDDGSDGRWRWGFDTAAINLNKLVPKFMPVRKIWGIFEKDYLLENEKIKPTSAWTMKDVNTERGTEQLIELGFDKEIFPRPKPLGLLKRIIELGTRPLEEDIILDFFAGSSTTAHSTMMLNAEDSGNRKFILIQLQEKTEEGSPAHKAGFDDICEIGKERVRRAGKKINRESGLLAQNLDTGFRVFTVDSTNMEDVYYTPGSYQQNILNTLADNIKPDRNAEDLLFQVMLDLGILLSSSIQEIVIGGKKVYSVADGYLLACFDKNVNSETVTEIAKRKPYYAIFRDSSMSDDSVATNFDQIFATYSATTVRKVL